MTEILNNAGALGLLIMGGTGLGVLAAAALGGLAFTKRRVPLFALIAFPYLVLAAGAFGAWVASATAGSAVAAAAPADVASMAMSQAWASMAVDWVARWGAAIVLCAGVWAAAIGSAIVPGEEPRFTFTAAGGAAGTAVIGAIALLGYGAYSGFPALSLAALVLVNGFGVAAASTRRAADDDMFRVAGMRFAASVCALLSIWHAGRAVEIGNRMAAFEAGSALMTNLDILKAIETYDAMISPGLAVGVMAILIGVILAFNGFFTEIAEVAVRFTVYDCFFVVVSMVGVGLFRLVEMSGFNGLYAVAMNGPAVEAYHEMAGNLPSSVVPVGEQSAVARLAEGGFGDVLTLGEHWVRTAKWTGSNWEEVHEELEQVTDLSDRPPLLSVGRPDQASRLFEVLDRVPEGKAFLLLRAAEVKPGVAVPDELARLQVTFLPIQKSTSANRDLKAHLWLEAGAPEVMFGPTVWFGEGDEVLDPLEYATAARTATASPGVHVLAGERKVGDVVNACMNYLLDKKGEAEVAFTGERWCAVAPEDEKTLVAEAAAVTEIPNPENVRLALEIEGPLTASEVEEMIRREMGALSYCATKATTPDPNAPPGGPPPEELKGRMDLNLAVGREGDVYDTSVDEKSKVQSPAILKCAAKRFRRLTFTLPPAEPPAPVEPGAKPPPPPTPPKVKVHLDFPAR
jgi:hypothetical protein